MFLKEKCNNTIKARGCANERKQLEKYENSDAILPMVSTDAVLISAAIDAYKERDVAVFNTPGACLNTGMDDDVFMIFWGALDKLIIAVDTTLGRNYISKENNGGALLYVHV